MVGMKRGVALVLASLALAFVRPAFADEVRPRLIVVTDIGADPDDSESFVRLLLYANDLDLEGLIAATSYWQKDRVRPDLLRERVAAYGEVLPNLRVHDPRYPPARTARGTDP